MIALHVAAVRPRSKPQRPKGGGMALWLTLAFETGGHKPQKRPSNELLITLGRDVSNQARALPYLDVVAVHELFGIADSGFVVRHHPVDRARAVNMAIVVYETETIVGHTRYPHFAPKTDDKVVGELCLPCRT